MFHPVSIRINVLTNFLLVIFLIAASLLGLQYYFSQQLAMSAAYKSFSQTSEKITQYIQSRDQMSKNLLYIAEHYPDITSPVSSNHYETISRLTHNMKRTPNLYAMYIGHDDGDFLEVINMKQSPELHQHFNAPEQTRWTIIKVFDSLSQRVKQFEYYDVNLNRISSRQELTDYYANIRPWFIQAAKNDNAIRTDIYKFSHLQQNGLTFAKRIHNSTAVLAADITLKRLNQRLKELKEDESNVLTLFSQDGTPLASSDSSIHNTTISTALLKALEDNKTDQLMDFYDQDVRKFFMVTLLSHEQEHTSYLGLSINADVILNPYMKQISYSLVVAFVFLIFTIPLILYSTSRIIKPIKDLMHQNNKIKERRYDDISSVHSNIIELIDLSDSLVSMAKSIQAHEKAEQELMDSFIRLIADAIDAKSSYTGGHCQRVPEIAMMIAKAAHESNSDAFKDFQLQTSDAWREFKVGAWLHDCGKVTTPEYVVDKSTKLETIYNRIHEIRTRFEVLWRDIEIEYYQRLLNKDAPPTLEQWKRQKHQILVEDFEFIAECNIGGEFLSEDKKQRIHQIAQQTWTRHFNDRSGLSDTELLRYQGIREQQLPATEPLLRDKPEHLIERDNFDPQVYQQQGFKMSVPEYLYNYGELYNLCIEKGTLTEEERFKINEHVIMSIKMLEMLPYPEHMKQIPEYAGTHHETMIGTGYPRKLSKAELSIPARIMAIADIFEALTASDRPYKKGKTLSESIRIMELMKKDQHIDSDIFRLFIQSGVYKEYAASYLKPEQIDDVDLEALEL